MNPTISAFKNSPDGGKGQARDMRVRWALEEVNQPYNVQLFTFDQLKSPEYLAVHPFGQIPVYQQDDLTLFESGAIVLHIAEQHDQLLPDEPNARSCAITWLFAALNTVEPPLLDIEEAILLDKDKPWFEQRLPQLKQRAHNRLAQLSNYLADREWLEDSFTLGDLMMIAVLFRTKETEVINDFPNLLAYMVRGEARPAFKRAFAAQLAVFKASQAQE